VAFSGATDILPELNRWLQIVEMETSVRQSLNKFHHAYRLKVYQFKTRLTASMIIDFAGCWVLEKTCKYFFADLEPKEMVTRGRERREERRRLEELAKAAATSAEEAILGEKKVQ
jgi:cation-transporting ATPase 13A1